MKAETTASIEWSGLKSPQTQQESVWHSHFTYFPGNCCTGTHLARLHTTITSCASSKPVRLTEADALRPHKKTPDTTDHTTYKPKSQATCLKQRDLWCYVIRALSCAVLDGKKTFCNIKIHALILNYLSTGLGLHNSLKHWSEKVHARSTNDKKIFQLGFKRLELERCRTTFKMTPDQYLVWMHGHRILRLNDCSIRTITYDHPTLRGGLTVPTYLYKLGKRGLWTLCFRKIQFSTRELWHLVRGIQLEIEVNWSQISIFIGRLLETASTWPCATEFWSTENILVAVLAQIIMTKVIIRIS